MKTYPGAELILTPPTTPEPVLIDEGIVSNMLKKYKSHFSTNVSTSKKNLDQIASYNQEVHS